MPQPSIVRIIENIQKSTNGILNKTFTPELYNIFTIQINPQMEFFVKLSLRSRTILKAWHTQQGIAEIMGVPQPSIVRIIENIQKRTNAILDKTFTPLLYNICLISHF
ncbi:MAG TPA: hypothetical protein DCM62_10170 [Bacteroidales bacterium]|nr:hypothetical protein [Bacteroidales bacterium]